VRVCSTSSPSGANSKARSMCSCSTRAGWSPTGHARWLLRQLVRLRKRKIQLLRWADVSAPSVVLGTAVTRIGCLLYGCDYGRRADDLPWAIRFPPGAPAFADHHSAPRTRPGALASYPCIHADLRVAGRVRLVRVAHGPSRVRRFSGEVFVGWVLGYGVLRSIIEIYRGDADRGAVGPLSTSQFIGVLSAAAGLVLLFFLLRSSARTRRRCATGAPAGCHGGQGGSGRGQRRKRHR